MFLGFRVDVSRSPGPGFGLRELNSLYPNPKAPCRHIVYTYTLKYPYRNPFKAQVYTYCMGTWSLRETPLSLSSRLAQASLRLASSGCELRPARGLP